MKCCNCVKGYLVCMRSLSETEMFYICDACGWKEINLKSDRPDDNPIYDDFI